MEPWFLAAVGGAVFAGVSNFYFKQAAARGYSAELFSLYGGLISIVLVLALLLVYPTDIKNGWVVLVAFFGGCIAGNTNIFKVLALRYIDSTIYFPIYKLIAPALAIFFGLVFFAEEFSNVEWVGMVLGLLVPLMLITPSEHGRQNNLLLGLVLVVLTGFTSATSAALNKFATDSGMAVLAVLLFASAGIFVGTLGHMVQKKGIRSIKHTVVTETAKGLLLGATLRAVLISVSLGLMLYAYALGGTLAIVQTIHSMYILIPIVLAIIFYNEHWNVPKIVAIVLSVAALALLA